MQHAASPASYAETIGVRPIEATPDCVTAELDFRTHLQQGTGVFHAGAIMALVHTTATQCAALNVPEGSTNPAPRLVQFSSALFRNAGAGSTIRAESRPVQRGRSLMVVETTVSDNADRHLATMTATYMLV